MKTFLSFIFVLIATFSALSSVATAITPHSSVDMFAVNVFKEQCQGKTANSSVCQDATPDGNPLFGKNGIITSIINILSIIAGIAAVVVIIVSGLKFVTSGSNPQDANNAREGILYALIGLLFAVLAQAIVQLFLSKIP